MSQKDVEVLRKARDRLVEDRRGLAESLAKPYDRGNTENWRVHLVEVQQAITAVDEGIKEEETLRLAGCGASLDFPRSQQMVTLRSGLSETRGDQISSSVSGFCCG